MKKIILLLSLVVGNFTFAQTNGQEIQEQEFKLSALPYYNYGKGLGMTSADSLFQLNIRFRMQNRVTYYDYEDEASNYEAQIRRLRLRLDGYVGNPKFQYVLQLSFAPGDVGGALVEGENLNIIRDAAVSYVANENWNFLFGQTKLPGNRQRVNSSGSLQLTDRSINNAQFNIDRDFGFQANHLREFKEKFSYRVKTAVSSGNGRNWSGKDENVALTGKLEVLPFGTFKKGGEYFEGDIQFEEKPKVLFSGSWHKNYNASLTRGQQGDELFESRDLQSVFIDALAKYRGWAGMFSYMNRTTDDPLTSMIDQEGVTQTRYVFAGEGMDYQLSYTFPVSHYEIIGRFSTQNVDDKIYQLNVPNQKQYSLGITKYIWEHAFKIQTEFTYDQMQFHTGEQKGNWYVRFQIEIGI
ncbi:MAG TPA: porin [Flavobacterium sp.]|nr:porin [Flavobacterium sp.]